MRTTLKWTLLALAFPVLAHAAPDAKKLYEKSCLKCHGAEGAGDGKAAKILKPKPTDFTSAKWQGERSDAQITEVIRLGAKATTVKDVSKKMPAFGTKLSDEEVKALVPLVRGFQKK